MLLFVAILLLVSFALGQSSFPIATCTDLQNILFSLTSSFHLTNNIDCSDTRNWNDGAGFSPLGYSQQNTFRGLFEGNGYSISNIFIFRPSSNYVALFGANEGTIRNLRISQAFIEGNEKCGIAVGAWEMSCAGNISNVIIDGGYLRCHDRMSGGIAGYNCGTIINSHTVDTTIACESNCGGIVGWLSGNYAEIIDSSSSGSIVGIDDKIGGAVGYLASGVSTYMLLRTFSTASVQGLDWVGGLIGDVGTISGTISNCYSIGNVTGRSYVGGFAGQSRNEIERCYSAGKVTGTSNVGGFAGYGTAGDVMYSYWDTVLGFPFSPVGSGKTTEEMMQSSTYQTWDFIYTWDIEEGKTYPFLQDF